jgi:hypothetical protein
MSVQKIFNNKSFYSEQQVFSYTSFSTMTLSIMTQHNNKQIVLSFILQCVVMVTFVILTVIMLSLCLLFC